MVSHSSRRRDRRLRPPNRPLARSAVARAAHARHARDRAAPTHAAEHRRNVLERLSDTASRRASTASESRAHRNARREGVAAHPQPRLADASVGARRRSRRFVRVGRVDDRFTYAPLVIKNHEVTEAAVRGDSSRVRSSASCPPTSRFVDGLGTRRAPPMTRARRLVLDGATRILQAFGPPIPRTRGALIDRNIRLWWFDLASPSYPRSNLAAYDRLYEERVDVLRALDEWFDVGGRFPTSPYWHRDCLTVSPPSTARPNSRPSTTSR